MLSRFQKASLIVGAVAVLLPPAQAETSSSTPRSGKFVFDFQLEQEPTYQTFVVPLDFQTGVLMEETANTPWTPSSPSQFSSSFMLTATGIGAPNHTQAVKGPVAYFGSAVQASPMYEDTSYRFAFHAGDTSTPDYVIPTSLVLYVYQRSSFGTAPDMGLVQTLTLPLPTLASSNAYHEVSMAAATTDDNGQITVASTAGMNVGNTVVKTGSGPFPDGAKIVSIDSTTTLTLSPAATATHANATLTFRGVAISVPATTTTGNPIVTVSSTTGMGPGESVSGTGIPVGTMIVSVDSASTVTLSAPATVTASNTLSFGGPGAWTAFGDKGYQATLPVNVTIGSTPTTILDTTVQMAMTGSASGQWGDCNRSPLLLTHKAHAKAELYYFVVGFRGGTQVGDTAYWMTQDANGDSTVTYGYGMNFDPVSPWSSKLLTTPSFQGEPMPPAYHGKAATEIESQAEPVALNLGAPGNQYNGYNTPELQPHSALDALVAKMKDNPMALAAYVQNNIALTDALAYNNQGNLNETSVNAGGMERSAVGTLLEGQGSPEEQCALLVYLLRKAGHKAAYVVPPHNSLKLADQRLSNLLRMRIAGARGPDGTSKVPQFIYCNYPFVAAYVPANGTSGTSQWVPLFPWLKDTEVKQGLNVNNFLPDGASSIRQWVRNFLLAKSNSTLWNSDTSPLSSATLSGETTATSSVVNLPVDSGIVVGQTVQGAGIDPGTLVTRVENAKLTSTLVCTTTDDSPRVIVPLGTAGLAVGQPVKGTGVPAGARIETINGPTMITLNTPADASHVNGTLSFEAGTFIFLSKPATASSPGTPLAFKLWDRTPGGFFLKSLAKNLLDHYPGISVADLGVSFLDRKYNYTSWAQFPQPIPAGLIATRQGATTTDSSTVTMTSLADLVPGQTVSGDGIPAGTTIAAINSTLSTIALSQAATATGSNVSLKFSTPTYTRLGATSTSGGGTAVTMTNVSDLVPGLAVAGAGIPKGTTISGISGNVITLSQAATETSSGNVPLTFRTYFPASETLMGGTSPSGSADSALYDTADIVITSYNASNAVSQTMTLSGLRVMDLHNRRAVINFEPLAASASGVSNSYYLNFSLAPYDMASSSDTGTVNTNPGTNFAYGGTDAFMRLEQRRSMTVTSAEQNYTFSVVYHRDRRYTGATTTPDQGGWSHFLGTSLQDFGPYSARVSETINGSTSVTLPGGTAGLGAGMLVFGAGIPPSTTIASLNSTTITLSQPAIATSAPTVVLSYGEGARPTPPVVSYFTLGDLNAFCVNTGRVTPAMLDLHVQNYDRLQQKIALAPNTTVPAPDLDTMQGTMAYLMGMSYYQRMSTSMEALKNLFQVNAVSTRAHGFAQLGAQKFKNAHGSVVGDGSGNPLPLAITPANSTGFRIQQIYPKVDMNYAIETHVGYDDLRADAGGQGTLVTPDFYTNLMVAQMSSLESQTIAQYFGGQNTDAVSTVALLQKVQLGLNGTDNPDIIELNSSNYGTLGRSNHTVGGVTKTLSDWAGGTTAGSLWSSITAAFNGWDKDQVRVYVTPGESLGANRQWKGMVALILGRGEASALIGSLNSLNGGVGASTNFFGLTKPPISGTAPAVSISNNSRLVNTKFMTNPAFSLNTDLSTAVHEAYLMVSNFVEEPFAKRGSSNAQLTNLGNLNLTAPTIVLATGPFDALLAKNSRTGTTVGSIFNASSSGQGLTTGRPGGTAGLVTTTPLGTMVVNWAGMSPYTGDPVNTMTGELYTDETDLVLPGPLPLQIRRNYSSRSLGSGEFGYGWKTGMFPYLAQSKLGTVDKIQAAEMDGTVITYTRVGSTATWEVTRADNPLLSNGSGMSIGSVRNLFYNTLTRSTSGTPDTDTDGITYTLKGADGSVRVYTVKSFAVGTAGATISRRRPYLTSWKDSVENSLTFHYYGDSNPADWYSVTSSHPAYGQLACVQASNGNFVTFNYDAYGHVVNIAAADGRQLNYTYDEHGDLRQVTFPDGSWTKYDYLIQIGQVGSSSSSAPYSTHLISQETRPGGRQVQTYYVTFKAGDKDENGNDVASSRIDNDVSTARRVHYQLASVGEGGKTGGAYDVTKPVTNTAAMAQNATYAYHLNTDADGNITGRTEITDAYGRTTTYYYVNSRLVQIMDPLSDIGEEEGDAETGTGDNPKMVQTWYTDADVTNNEPGAWAGGLKSIYQRGGTRTTFQYSPKVANNPTPALNTPGGDVTQISVEGYLDGTSGPSGTVSVDRASSAAMPALSGFTPPNTATTTATYSTDERHVPLTITRPDPASGNPTGRHTVYTYDTNLQRRYLVAQVDEYATLAAAGASEPEPLNSTTTTYQDVSVTVNSVTTSAKGLPHVVTVAAGIENPDGTSAAAKTTWTYNANGFPTQRIASSGLEEEVDKDSNPDSIVQYAYDLRGQLAEEKVMNADGTSAVKTNVYAYDEMGRPIWVERRDAAGRQLAWNYTYYNLNGDVEWTQGSRLNPADYTYTRYDGAGRPIEKTAWRSRANTNGSGVESMPGAELYATTTYSYNMFGDLIGSTDPVGHSVRATYDAIGRKIKTVAYEGNWQSGSTRNLATTSTAYIDEELCVITTDALGGVTKVYTTSDGKLRRKINPDGTELKWTYYLDGRLRKQQLSETTYVEFEYNDVDRTVKKVTGRTGSTTDKFTETTTADARGNIISTMDVAGLTTTVKFDALNRPMTSTIPAATTTETGLTSAARNLKHSYDAAGFMHKVTNLGANVSAANADADDEITETNYDALGRVIHTQVTRGDSNVPVSQSSVSYSADSQSVTTTTGIGAGAISETAWTDLAGRTVLVKHADNTYASTSYDAAGNAIAAKDETGLTTNNTYDGLQRPLTTRLPDGAETTFCYNYLTKTNGDGDGQTIERNMPGDLTEFTQLDAFGRPKESYLKGAGGLKTRIYKDYAFYSTGPAKGLLHTYTDPNNHLHEFEYDEWLRPKTTKAGTPGTPEYVERTFVTYNSRGMATKVQETTSAGVSQKVSLIERSYDTHGHLWEEKVSLGSSTSPLTLVTDLTATYDHAGRRKRLDRRCSPTASPTTIRSLSDAGGYWGFEYRADSVLSKVDAGGDFIYTYGDNGLLKSRSNPFREFSVTTTGGDYGRDSRGRIEHTQTARKSGGVTPLMAENVALWSSDNKQRKYSCKHLPDTPSAWVDKRDYDYSLKRRQLTEETWTASPNQQQTLNYTFDGGNPGGLGVRTKASTNTAGVDQWHKVREEANITGQDAWQRPINEEGGFENRFPIVVKGKALGAASVELRVGATALLDQVSFPAATVMSEGAWSRSLSMPAGNYALNATAHHPSGQFSPSTSSSFTLAARNFKIYEDHDSVGNVTSRIVTDDTGPDTYVRTQTLKWDAEGRLMSVTQTDDSPESYNFVWSATYDASGRRVRAQTGFTGKHPQTGRTLTETSWHDPLVEFLEVGLEVAWSGTSTGTVTAHERWWKVHGPDLNGGYGGLQGMGGLEAMVNEVNGEIVGFIDDMYGHILGFATAPGLTTGSPSATPFLNRVTTFEWSLSRFGGYGPLPGYWSPAIADGVATWRTFGWRGRRMEVTGYYHLGARYYNSSSGRFMSADPLGHGASMSLYDYANGDPINFVDPRGRKAGEAGAVTDTPAAQQTQYLPFGPNSSVPGAKYMDSAYSTVRNWFSSLRAMIGGVASAQVQSSLYANEYLVKEEDKERYREIADRAGKPAAELGDAIANTFNANRRLAGGSIFGGLNITLNPIYKILKGSFEFNEGISLDPNTIGRDLDYYGQVYGGAEALGGIVDTVLISAGAVSATRNVLSAFGSPGDAIVLRNPSWCFPPGTLVLMADGSGKPIERIEEGDWVLANSPEDEGPAVAREILHRFNGKTDRLIQINFDRDQDGLSDGRFKATGLHPVWVVGAGWKSAANIQRGDLLIGLKGFGLRVIDTVEIQESSTTHNLCVDGVHTFYIVADGQPVLVHNQNFLIGPHGDMPSPRPFDMNSHHIIQDAWVRDNYWASYKPAGLYRDATAILIPRDPIHLSLNAFQNDFRANRIAQGLAPYSTSLREEFNMASQAMREAGINDAVRKNALKKAYKFFDSIGAFCQ